MEGLSMTFAVTEAYREAVRVAKDTDNNRKCRSWVDILNPTDGWVQVTVSEIGITLACNTPKGRVEETCGYDAVHQVTEQKDGILLRLSKTRLLLLPAGTTRAKNEALMAVTEELYRYCKYLKRNHNLRLPGIPIGKQLEFYIRKRKGRMDSSGFGRRILTALIVLSVFMGTVFVTMPMHSGKTDKAEALEVTIFYKGFEEVRHRRGSKSAWLYGADGDRYEVVRVCWNTELRRQLRELPVNTKLELLVEPGGDDVLQITANGEVLLDFDTAQDNIWRDAQGFVWLGAAVYAMAGYMVIILVRKKY